MVGTGLVGWPSDTDASSGGCLPLANASRRALMPAAKSGPREVNRLLDAPVWSETEQLRLGAADRRVPVSQTTIRLGTIMLMMD